MISAAASAAGVHPSAVSLFCTAMFDSSDSEAARLLGVLGDGSDRSPGCAPSVDLGDEGDIPVRRSSRLAQRAATLKEWPVHRILNSLYSRGVTPPRGCNHEELFAFFVECD